MTIKLDAIEFTSAPTKTQFENALGDIEKFLNKMVGSMLAEGHATAASHEIGTTLNAATTLRQARDISSGTAGLAMPQAGQGPQRMR